jgi:hypothetical protein
MDPSLDDEGAAEEWPPPAPSPLPRSGPWIGVNRAGSVGGSVVSQLTEGSKFPVCFWGKDGVAKDIDQSTSS